jgi:hypothetical protein
MLCALTHNKKLIWATFLDDGWSGTPELYLHNNPSLYYNDGNVSMNDIDYRTVTRKFGTFVNRHNFFDIALSHWSYTGGFELKTKDELESRVSGMMNNPVDLTDDDGCDYELSDIVIKLDDEDTDVSEGNAIEDSDEDIDVSDNNGIEDSDEDTDRGEDGSDVNINGASSFHSVFEPGALAEASNILAAGNIMTHDEAIAVQHNYMDDGYVNQKQFERLQQSIKLFGNLVPGAHLEYFS